ncbi:unnamed protein product [Malus baccata var. baccata]
MAGSSGADLRAPVFHGDNFNFWQIKMKTIFRSHDLWDMVEKGYSPLAKSEGELTATDLKLLKENIVKDAKAFEIIQGAVSDEIFPRIAILETAKEAWDALKQEFIGDKRWIYVVATLKGYEQRIERHSEDRNEKAFASLRIAPRKTNFNANQNFKPTKNWKSKGKKWDNKHVHQQGKFVTSSDGAKNSCKYCDKLHFGECWFKGKPRCHNCDKPEHFVKDCRSKKAVQQANYVGQVDNNPTMFYTCMTADVNKHEDTWYIDNGCSNHMTGREDLLVNIDKRVTAKGDLMVETKQGKRYIRDIMFVPGLKENLLSVGQMMEHGYYLVFGGIEVRIYDDATCLNLVVKVPMKGNRSFPLKLQPGIHFAMRASFGQSVEI